MKAGPAARPAPRATVAASPSAAAIPAAHGGAVVKAGPAARPSPRADAAATPVPAGPRVLFRWPPPVPPPVPRPPPRRQGARPCGGPRSRTSQPCGPFAGAPDFSLHMLSPTPPPPAGGGQVCRWVLGWAPPRASRVARLPVTCAVRASYAVRTWPGHERRLRPSAARGLESAAG